MKQQTPGDSKWPFYPLVGGHLTLEKGHLSIPKRSQRIARRIKQHKYIPEVKLCEDS